MTRLALLTIYSLLVIQVLAQKEDELNCEVRPVTSKLSVSGNQIFYALPKNTLRIEVEVERVTLFEGPYKEYAAKYLNISEGVIQADDEFYSITSAKFHRLSQADSSKFYAVTCTNLYGFPMLQLNSDGVIIGCNSLATEGYSTLTCPLLNPVPEADEYIFTDLGIKPFLFEKTQTLYKTVATDTTPTRVSYTETKQIETTTEMNAEAAASFIRKLRKRRFKLIYGDKEEVVNIGGGEVAQMIKELEKLEQRYINLFIGKTVRNSFTYYFDFEPDEQSVAEQQIVGWFSRKKGLEIDKPDMRKTDFKPLIIFSNLIGKVPRSQIQIMDQSQKTPTAIKYGLFYRIPGRIDVTLKYTNRVLARQEWEIAQKGQIVPLPVSYLNNQNYSIEFYPETGGLKRIYLKD
ncbi:MAG: DUF4831 family protein [Salinivirgaceae bacterium]|jgi:hypothetical protein|nr:DUF4831 family protein [Salinivirgaceae bacterium]